MDELLTRIDWTYFSPWLILILYIVLTKWADLQGGLGTLFKSHVEERSDRREHQQRLEESQADVWAQAVATAAARQRELDNLALEYLHEAQQWSKQEFGEMHAKLIAMHHAINRANDLTVLQNQLLAGMYDEIKTLCADLDGKRTQRLKPD